ncbi:PrgI family protein [Oscillospiraceae bacterium MB24-C1]|nr:PrgI family protein [Oscillospiraceae bacterium MB24-C1]
MPYVNIPKDLSGVQAKLMFGLTKRGLIVAALAVVVYLPLYFFLKSIIGGGAVWLMMLLAAPPFIWGLYPVHDSRPIEKIVFNFLRVHLKPQVRPYRTENLYACMELAGKIEEVIEDADADAQSAENEGHKKSRSLRKAAKKN